MGSSMEDVVVLPIGDIDHRASMAAFDASKARSSTGFESQATFIFPVATGQQQQQQRFIYMADRFDPFAS